jgi:hypothetical protein
MGVCAQAVVRPDAPLRGGGGGSAAAQLTRVSVLATAADECACTHAGDCAPMRALALTTPVCVRGVGRSMIANAVATRALYARRGRLRRHWIATAAFSAFALYVGYKGWTSRSELRAALSNSVTSLRSFYNDHIVTPSL